MNVLITISLGSFQIDENIKLKVIKMSIILDEQIYTPKSTVICVYPMHEVGYIYFFVLLNPFNFCAASLIVKYFFSRNFQFYFNQHAIFEKFGKLRFVGIEKRNDVRIGLIEFEDDSVADELISKGYMEIEDNKCEVKSYEEFKRKSKLVSDTVLQLDCAIGALLHPPKQDSCKHILNVLNDDCLREIFTKLHLSTLMSVANVCIRFDRVAKEAFSSKYKSKKIRIGDLTWDRKPTKSQVTNFFSKFGSSISSVSLVHRSPSRYSVNINEDTHLDLRIISKYCNGLKELEFSAYHTPESTLKEIFLKLKTLFERLRTLRVYFIKSRSFFEIISACSNLEVLDVYFDLHVESLIPSYSTLPKLVEATFNCYACNDLVCEAIHKFLEVNSKLKVLRITSADFVSNSGYLSELKEFDFKVNHLELQSIVATLSSPNIQIENLKVSLDSDFYTELTYIPTFGNITEFRMRNQMPTFDEMWYLLEHMPNLETFHISYKFHTKNETLMTIKSILQHASHSLSKLVFEGWHLFIKSDKRPHLSFPIDDVEYYEILKSVEDRTSGIKLTIQLFFHKILHDEYVKNTQAIYILNTVPKFLTIEQRVSAKRFFYPI